LTDSIELDAARQQVDEAIRAFVKVRAREAEIADRPIVTSWVVFAEYTSNDLEVEDSSGRAVIIPNGQMPTTTRGCYEYGADAFRGH
jgi:hypothetical protein